MKKNIFIAILLLSVGIFCTQSFVAKKQEKPKKESRSQLKERVCQGLYDLLHRFSDILAALSSAQRSILQSVSDFIASEKSNIIDSASDSELKSLESEMAEIITMAKSLEMKLLLLIPRLSKKNMSV